MPRAPSRPRRRTVFPVVVVVAAGTEIALAAAARPFTVLSDVVVSIALAAMLAVVAVQRLVHSVPRAVARRPPRVDAQPAGAWWPWVVLVLLVTAWELFCFATSPRPDHPTLSSLLDMLTVHGAWRAVAFTGWLALGGYLVTR
jgi:hypothetical protein